MEEIHDRVVREIVSHLNNKSFDIYINPGQEKNAGIGDNYPDVVMTEKGRNTVKFILEVETEDSVTKDEAINQWKKYTSEINATFYLVVPAALLNKAKELCQRENINSRYATYSFNGCTLTFDFQ